ncbi:hypothetical protein DICPUDRAFT_155311 [Dictyostelium purpureum]|uniref:Chromatin accessibility complex protein 1 n=1 Tax=Dictyostelium purpureum TaxID=5786 RepID=F0ZTN1_DICPU|nr:uncharacterized protein DICPUDRAFT_155311 [Dictyostelium purpureum]EGC32707.1 hypothetical protein DICPUDRAFT_155311 [Dictyostelium purpureum]|eukprot:XP_003290776.1 hypothetical protein DICPUDRAFT_155311 [Dictyostelium purpureum]
MTKDDEMKEIDNKEDEIEDEVEEEEEDKEEELEDEVEEEDEDKEEDKEEDKDTKDIGDSTATTANTADKKKKVSRSARSHDTQLPIARIKRIMKNDKDVKLISSDALMLVTKSTELFLDYFCKEAYKKTKSQGRKILSYKDISSAIKDIENLTFLTEIVPEKITMN